MYALDKNPNAVVTLRFMLPTYLPVHLCGFCVEGSLSCEGTARGIIHSVISFLSVLLLSECIRVAGTAFPCGGPGATRSRYDGRLIHPVTLFLLDWATMPPDILLWDPRALLASRPTRS